MLYYLTVAAVMLFSDAILCHAMKRRFNLVFCLPASLIWPVTIPVIVIGSAYLTRDMPKAGT